MSGKEGPGPCTEGSTGVPGGSSEAQLWRGGSSDASAPLCHTEPAVTLHCGWTLSWETAAPTLITEQTLIWGWNAVGAEHALSMCLACSVPTCERKDGWVPISCFPGGWKTMRCAKH